MRYGKIIGHFHLFKRKNVNIIFDKKKESLVEPIAENRPLPIEAPVRPTISNRHRCTEFDSPKCSFAIVNREGDANRGNCSDENSK